MKHSFDLTSEWSTLFHIHHTASNGFCCDSPVWLTKFSFSNIYSVTGRVRIFVRSWRHEKKLISCIPEVQSSNILSKLNQFHVGLSQSIILLWHNYSKESVSKFFDVNEIFLFLRNLFYFNKGPEFGVSLFPFFKTQKIKGNNTKTTMYLRF